MRETPCRLAGEEVQQVEFSRREVQRAAVEGDFAGDRVDGQTVEDQAASIHFQVARHGVDPAQQRFDPGHQFQHGKRLGQVIVGPQFQAENAVHFAGAGAGDDDRRVARHGPGARQISGRRRRAASGRGSAHPNCLASRRMPSLPSAQCTTSNCSSRRCRQIRSAILIVLDHEDSFGLFHPAQSFGAMNALCEMLLISEVCSRWRSATPAFLTHHREACSYMKYPGIVRLFPRPGYHELFNSP
jgi:hypothetical protein